MRYSLNPNMDVSFKVHFNAKLLAGESKSQAP